MSDTGGTTFGVVILRIYAFVLLAVGLALGVGGANLLRLGGSPYYVLCGAAVVVSAVLLWRRHSAGALVYGLMLLATLAWALWEAGYEPWALMPRIVAPAVLGLVLLLPAVRRALIRTTAPVSVLRLLATVVIAGVAGVALRTVAPPHQPVDPLYQTGTESAPASTATVDPGNGDWLHFGNDPGGSRFSPLAQITTANVAQLQPAWTAKVDTISRWHTVETTPLKVGRTLYLCSSRNDLLALDAETGRQLWHHESHTDIASAVSVTCRGIAYYKAPNITGACAERVITNTVDARLIAVDARDGTSCPDFGTNGEVSLLTGMGEVIPGYYFVTSAPTLVQGKVVIGGWVSDNQYVGEPSGVIRAFDAVTGKLSWAWDMGQPDRTGEPPAGETYTRATANAWGPMSVDENLGLVYMGLGNPTPDFYGVNRRPYDEEYGSSVVALDVATGRPRWHFQVVHHDLWDYDVSPQPVLVDYPTADGVVRALLQPNKRGELFVLDRATGAPLKTVNEHPAPQNGALPEEKLSPTQPFSDGMPSFRGADMVEGDMWGITPLDQLWCRTKFREARYEGPVTPPGVTPSLEKPGKIGGMNWGSVAVDAVRHIVIVNTNDLPNNGRLIPRAEAVKMGVARQKANEGAGLFPRSLYAMEETPYAAFSGMFMSPLQIPCTRPPYGRISAVDLVTGKLIWSKPLGTARDIGPMGLKSHLPLPLGTINFGGATVTQGGVTFIAAAQDKTLRAFETATGKELWSARLPEGASATPMTYISPDTGRQFVVVGAGAGASPEGFTDYLVAFVLPKTAGP